MSDEMNLPKKAQLIKMAREETISVSLRVKESTYVVFKKMADEAGVKLGTMINTLLDFYAQNNAKQSGAVAKDVMANYLNSERFWREAAAENSEDLIYRLNNRGMVYPLMENFENTSDVVKTYKAKQYEDIWICPEIANDVWFDIHIADKAYYEECDDEHLLYVTAEQWPLVSVLIMEYGRKYHKLFPESPTYMTPGMLADIAKSCAKNKKANSTLAAAIKNVLLSWVEGMEYD